MAGRAVRQHWCTPVVTNRCGRLLQLLVVLTLGCSAARANEPRDMERQTREFSVTVDGTERGTLTMQIQSRDDGTERVQIETIIRFNVAVLHFRYTSSGAEIWKNDRMLTMENNANYNGKKYQVKAGPVRTAGTVGTAGTAGTGFQVSVNGKTAEARPSIWSTSYWRIPERLAAATEGQGVAQTGGEDTAVKSVSVSLLDSDKGRLLRGELSRVGEELLSVSGQKVACTHYHLAGDVKVDLWYDASRTLVRQDLVEQGHKTTVKLSKIEAE